LPERYDTITRASRGLSAIAELLVSKRLKQSALMVGSWIKSERERERERERVPDCGAGN